ncbi:aspartate aminotransferase family protein [Aeromicrobium fastidiosum]|uniref:(S)-3-amino-2-methylpropionate transaminase n=1 Tax=Aeromicrobium fastidiosum TaxID=52699 RepID=A0A641AKN0_9ACTN|nr:aminotransferase class III-fold pyridoxal phosphate-dependent enzyme [Aeromicrobium fastidiosum]KAA1373099.1 aminotransferase class III-fold pyridoxal phosphate-dependent enzyme [Aeromicrobium fastidiosum]MBP2391085.1 4-aminobutyrate aminotransferase [Aeromicrobium fastidiosum]
MSASLSPLLTPATPVVVDHGAGSYVYDADGRSWLDFTTGIGVTSTGHCHPAVVAAAREQVGKLIHGQFTTVRHNPILRLTEMLGDVLPTGLDSVFYANSGSEAVEASLRLARMATGRNNIIAFQGGFHGRTFAAATLTTAGTKFRTGFGALVPGVYSAPFPYALRYGWDEETAVDFALQELDFLLSTTSAVVDTAAFIIEPVLGDGGYLPTPLRFLQGLRERADQHGIVLIVDEVQTGVGRTGTFWGHEPSGIVPDILITAKGIASGFPISAIAASTSLMSKAWPGSQGGTYGGNAVSCAAAIATLGVVESEGLVQNSAAQGERLIAGLREAAASVSTIADVRGRGLMIGIEFTDPDGTPRPDLAAGSQQAAIDEGLLLLTCGTRGNVVRFIPPLIVTSEQVDEGVAAWSKAVAAAGA